MEILVHAQLLYQDREFYMLSSVPKVPDERSNTHDRYLVTPKQTYTSLVHPYARAIDVPKNMYAVEYLDEFVLTIEEPVTKSTVNETDEPEQPDHVISPDSEVIPVESLVSDDELGNECIDL